MTTTSSPTPRYFHGWNIVALACLCQFFSVGLAFYSFGVFLDPIMEHFGWTKGATSVGFSLYTIATATTTMFVGRALVHGSPRRFVIFGSLWTGAGLILMGTIASLPALYVYQAVFIGAGVVCMGGITAATVVNNWFLRSRAMAMSITSVGVSAAGLVSTPLIERLIHAFGWRSAYQILGAVEIAVVLPLVLLLLRDRPEDMGLHRDGLPPVARRPEDGEDPDERLWRYGELLRDRNFYLLLGSFTLSVTALTSVIVHMVSDITSKGFSRADAALTYSACAGIGIFGKPLFGWLGDRMDKRQGIVLASLLQALGTAMLITLPRHGSLVLVAIPMGLGVAGTLPLFSATTGDFYGRRSFSKVSSLMSPVMVGLQAVGYSGAGYVFDRTGSYHAAHLVFLGMYVASAVLIAGLRPASRALLPPVSPARSGVAGP